MKGTASLPSIHARLTERTARLAKLMHLDAPEAIVAMGVIHVLKTALACYPRAVGQALADWQTESALRASGICLECRRAEVPRFDAEWCTACQLRAREEGARQDVEDLLASAEDATRLPAKGSAS